MDVGSSECLTFNNWYATSTNNKNVSKLQLILDTTSDYDPTSTDPTLNKKIEQFDFVALASKFDQALVATPTLNSWALTHALASYQLNGSDTSALGGDLAYQYGKVGNLSGIGINATQAILADAAFGSGVQALKPLASLQDGVMKLM
jgi:hypothetical protein